MDAQEDGRCLPSCAANCLCNLRVARVAGLAAPNAPYPLDRGVIRHDMPAGMNTESRRRASAAYHAKREAAGLKKVTLWLSPAAREKLETLKAKHGSKDAAAEAAIMGLKP